MYGIMTGKGFATKKWMFYRYSYRVYFKITTLTMEEDAFAEQLRQSKVTFVGGGAAKFQAVCQSENAEFLSEVQPSARVMAATAQRQFDAGQFEDVAYFEPYYLKDFMPG